MIFDVQEIKDYIRGNPEAKIIIGGDSQKVGKKQRKKNRTEIKKKTARFVTCVIVYQKDKNKIFFEVSRELDIDHNPGKPMMRMLKETEKIVEIAAKLEEVLMDRNFEIHLDINKQKIHGSNIALASAVGYVWGVLGVEPIVKPDSWAASCVADHIVKTNADVLGF